MATARYTPRTGAVAQVNTITPANVGIGNTFTVTINTRSVTVTATAATVANVTGLLVTALQASDYPEFAEITWTDSTTHVTATSATAGVSFTQTSSASGGTATLTTSTTTSATGPGYWSSANNWSGAAVPVDSDDVIIDHSEVNITDGLAQSSIQPTTMRVAASYTGLLGRPELNNDAGEAYVEYRNTYLAIGPSALTIGDGEGDGSSRIKIDTGTDQTAIVVRKTAGGQERGIPAFCWKGTHASNTVLLAGGEMGAAVFGGESATIATLRVGSGGAESSRFVGGAGLTLTTLNQQDGTVELGAGLTTVNKTGGSLRILSGSVTTITNDSGLLEYHGTGTIGTLNVGTGGVADFSGDMRGCTVTDCNLYAGAVLRDPFGRVTFTNPIRLVRCTLADVTIEVAPHRTLAIST